MQRYDCLVTTADRFEGYRITDYFGIVSGVARVNGWNNTLDNITEVTELAVKRMLAQAFERQANAVVGMHIEYSYNRNVIDSAVRNEDSSTVVVVGTAVTMQSIHESKTWETFSCPVINYSPIDTLRPCELQVRIFQGDDVKQTTLCQIALRCISYRREPVAALQVSLQLQTVFNEFLPSTQLMFTSPQLEDNIVQTEFVNCEINKQEAAAIASAKVQLKKYVVGEKIVTGNEQFQEISMTREKLIKHREVFGIDVVTTREDLPDGWRCVCGHTNKAGAQHCAWCGRNSKSCSLSFDFIELRSLLKQQSNARGIKEVLTEHQLELPPGIFQTIMNRLDKMVVNERLYGNSKNEALEFVIEQIDQMSNTGMEEVTGRQKSEKAEAPNPPQIDTTKMLAALEELPNAKAVREVAGQYEPLLEPAVFDALIKGLDKIVGNERLYGNCRQDALVLLRKTMNQLTAPSEEAGSSFRFRELYEQLEQLDNARQIRDQVNQCREQIDREIFTTLLSALDEIVRNERIDQSRKQEALLAVRQKAGKLLEEQ